MNPNIGDAPLVRAMTSEDTIEAVKEELIDRLAESNLSSSIELDISQVEDDYFLDRIQSTERGKGNASRALKVLTQLCDEIGRNIQLTVRPLDQNTDCTRLRSWYVNHGFVDVGGSSNVMRRLACRTK